MRDHLQPVMQNGHFSSIKRLIGNMVYLHNYLLLWSVLCTLNKSSYANYTERCNRLTETDSVRPDFRATGTIQTSGVHFCVLHSFSCPETCILISLNVSGIQEYVEAVSFQHYIRHRTLISLEEINARLVFMKAEKVDPKVIWNWRPFFFVKLHSVFLLLFHTG